MLLILCATHPLWSRTIIDAYRGSSVRADAPVPEFRTDVIRMLFRATRDGLVVQSPWCPLDTRSCCCKAVVVFGWSQESALRHSVQLPAPQIASTSSLRQMTNGLACVCVAQTTEDVSINVHEYRTTNYTGNCNYSNTIDVLRPLLLGMPPSTTIWCFCPYPLDDYVLLLLLS